MKTILHRGDHRPDHSPHWWSIRTMLYLANKLPGATICWRKEEPQALEIEADRLFGPGAIMSHEDMMKLRLRMEFRPNE